MAFPSLADMTGALRRRLAQWRDVPRLMRSLWQSSPRLFVAIAVVRLLRVLQPPAMLGHQLVTNLLTQLQNAVTLLALVAGLVFFVPWLIVLLLAALLPTLLVEAHFVAAH
jgi:hypothetical protein